MEQLQRKFSIIQTEIQKQNNDINKRLEEISKEIKELDETFMKVKTLNHQLLDTTPVTNKKQIESDIKFNKYLYDLELRKKMSKKTFFKNQLQMRQMYINRCILFTSYVIATENKNQIQITQSFFAFVNYVYSEFVKNHQYLKEFYLEKKDIHENYVLLLSLYPTVDKERREKLEKNVLTKEEYEKLLNDIKELDKTLEEYKRIFKTEKPRISKRSLKNGDYFNFDIGKVVTNIYPGLQDEIQNTK